MSMSPVDGIVAVYVAYGVYRGRARGLADEAYRLLRVGVALLAGCGLYGVVSDLISRVIYTGDAVSGPVGFVATMLGTWSVLRVVRTKFTAALETRFAGLAEAGGAMAGGLRTAVMASSAMITAVLAGHENWLGHSWLGSLLHQLVGK